MITFPICQSGKLVWASDQFGMSSADPTVGIFTAGQTFNCHQGSYEKQSGRKDCSQIAPRNPATARYIGSRENPVD